MQISWAKISNTKKLQDKVSVPALEKDLLANFQKPSISTPDPIKNTQAPTVGSQGQMPLRDLLDILLVTNIV